MGRERPSGSEKGCAARLFAPPASAVTYKKQERIKKLAQIFLFRQEMFYGAQLRFDVVEVFCLNGVFDVNILENAF